MSLDTFKSIAIKFKPYVDIVRFLSLHGCGEALSDKNILKRKHASISKTTIKYFEKAVKN